MRPLLVVVSIALLARAVAAVIQVLYGINGLPIPGTQVFADYYVYYAPQLHYLSEGFVLYKDIPYLYMPGFIYSLLPFYLLMGTRGPAALRTVVALCVAAFRLEPLIAMLAVICVICHRITRPGPACATSGDLLVGVHP